MKERHWLLALGLLFATIPCQAGSIAEQQDAAVIESLRDAGSDLSKPHKIDFFFYFPDQASAEAAGGELQRLGYRVVGLAPTSDESAWHLQAFRSMVPELVAMNQSTRDLEALAARHGGDYDGWGTSVVEQRSND